MSRNRLRVQDHTGRAILVIFDRIRSNPEWPAVLAAAKAHALAQVAHVLPLPAEQQPAAMAALGGFDAIIARAIESTTPITDGSQQWGTVSSHSILRNYHREDIRHHVVRAAQEARQAAAAPPPPPALAPTNSIDGPGRSGWQIRPGDAVSRFHWEVRDGAKVRVPGGKTGRALSCFKQSICGTFLCTVIWDGSEYAEPGHTMAEDLVTI